MNSNKMKAVVQTKYGTPEVLQLIEVDKPVPRNNEVLLKIHATTVTATDSIFRSGKSFAARLFTGLTKPRFKTLGDELAGEIEAVGQDMRSFKKGDLVFGTAGPEFGAHAEYLCVGVNGVLTKKPDNVSFEEAASSVDGFLTALHFLRDTGRVQIGQNILIYGASGSVGVAAVQVANYLGAEVTGVCSTANLDMVKSLGAAKVIDYTKEDFIRSAKSYAGAYDVVFDTVGKTTFSRCRKLLKPQGVFLEAGMTFGVIIHVFWTSMFKGRKAKIAAAGLRPPAEIAKDLLLLKELMESGRIKPVLDRSYPLDQIAAAYAYVEQGHKKGNVAISLPG